MFKNFSKGAVNPLADGIKENNVCWIGDSHMLETSQERVKLLKAGFNSKTIEKLYIEGNNIKIIRTPIIIDLVEVDISQNLTKKDSPGEEGRGNSSSLFNIRTQPGFFQVSTSSLF